MAESITVAGAGKQIGRIGHAFHSARYDDFRIAGLNALRRKTDSFQAGAANLIDGHRCDVRQQACVKSSLARRILAEAGGDNVSHDDFVDLLGREPGAFNSGFHGDRAQLKRAHRFQPALEFSNRSADRTDDDGVFHGWETSRINIPQAG